MDGSVSTLAPVFAAAFATRNSWDAFLVGLAASIGAGSSMGFAEAMSDDGVLSGRGRPLIRGAVCGLMTAAGGLGHTLPYLIPDFRVATGIACAVAAMLDHLAANGGKPQKDGNGSISFLITGDEEGIAVNGTPKLLQWAAEHGEKFDHCLLGEPSNVNELGDTIKIGRRGSLNGHLIVSGRQGHVAYPQRADNPIRGLVALIAALQAEPLDAGSAQFSASHLEFTSIDVGNKTVNLIPGEARARFNIRFNDNHTIDSLKTLIEARAAKAAGEKIKFAFKWEPSNAGVFVTKPGPFTELVANTVAEVTGRKPELSTTGGTSYARFITHFCPVVEFGLVGQTMHQVDERVPVADLTRLTAIYRKIVEKYFS